jgi:hypothetical protein
MPIEETLLALLASPRVAKPLGVFNVSFQSITDFLLLRIGFRTKWPWPIEASSL